MIGSSVTVPLVLNLPARGRFTASTTSKGFGPGQVNPVTVAERSDSVSVLAGETASSLNVARPFVRATRSTATFMAMARSTATWIGLCSSVGGVAEGVGVGGVAGGSAAPPAIASRSI